MNKLYDSLREKYEVFLKDYPTSAFDKLSFEEQLQILNQQNPDGSPKYFSLADMTDIVKFILVNADDLENENQPIYANHYEVMDHIVFTAYQELILDTIKQSPKWRHVISHKELNLSHWTCALSVVKNGFNVDGIAYQDEVFRSHNSLNGSFHLKNRIRNNSIAHDFEYSSFPNSLDSDVDQSNIEIQSIISKLQNDNLLLWQDVIKDILKKKATNPQWLKNHFPILVLESTYSSPENLFLLLDTILTPPQKEKLLHLYTTEFDSLLPWSIPDKYIRSNLAEKVDFDEDTLSLESLLLFDEDFDQFGLIEETLKVIEAPSLVFQQRHSEFFLDHQNSFFSSLNKSFNNTHPSSNFTELTAIELFDYSASLLESSNFNWSESPRETQLNMIIHNAITVSSGNMASNIPLYIDPKTLDYITQLIFSAPPDKILPFLSSHPNTLSEISRDIENNSFKSFDNKLFTTSRTNNVKKL